MAAPVLLAALLACPVHLAPQESGVRIHGRLGSPRVTGERVFVGTSTGALLAFEKETGRELWRFETGAPLYNRPVLAEGRLVVGGQDGVLRSFDPETGEVQWSFECGRVAWPFRDRFVNGAVTVFEGMVLFSSEDMNVYALELENGEELWRCKLDEEPQALELPVVDGLALVGAWDGFLYAVDVGLGEIRWRSQTTSDHHGKTTRDAAGELIWVPDDPDRETLPGQAPYVTVVPLVVGDEVYFTDWTGNLMAVDLGTGKERWRFKPETADRRHVGSRFHLACFDDVLSYGTQEDGHLYGVDRKTGEKNWEMEIGGTIFGPFDAGEGVLLYLQEQGFALHALDARTREVLWERADAAGFPTVEEGVVYLPVRAGTLVGLDPRSGDEVWRLGS